MGWQVQKKKLPHKACFRKQVTHLKQVEVRMNFANKSTIFPYQLCGMGGVFSSPNINYVYVLLTVHLSIILDNDQLYTQLLYFTIRLL